MVTQMSCSADTQIIISGKTNFKGDISKFIDKLLEDNKTNVVTIHKDSVVLDLKDDYKIIGVSNEEKNSWKRISQISRHPANGGLVKVTTKTGRTTTATLSHSFLRRKEDGIGEIKGSDLKIGHRIPVARFIPVIENPIMNVQIGDRLVPLDRTFGWFCGAYLADGTINYNEIGISKIDNVFIENTKRMAQYFGTEARVCNKKGEYGPTTDTKFVQAELAKFLTDNYGVGSFDKFIGPFTYNSNIEFISGVLGGYFDGDGNINSKRQMIRNGSRSERLTLDICLLLSYVGVYASKLEETSKNYPGKVMHTICLQRKYAQIFKDKVGLQMKNKADELDKIIQFNNNRNKKYSFERMDLIPELENVLISANDLLGIKITKNLKNVGRDDLVQYISNIENAIVNATNAVKMQINGKLRILKQAANSDVLWDEIVNLEYINDYKDYVYDFTVPGNDSFMVDNGVLVHNTLKAFHSSGIAAKGTSTLGVARTKELLSFSKNIKTPQMYIYLNEEHMDNSEMANRIASHMKYTTLEQIRRKIEIYYDPNPKEKDGFMDKDNVKNVFYTVNPSKNSCQSDYGKLPWLIRVEMDREKMMDKDVTLLDIKSKFCNDWERRYHDIKALKKEERSLLEKITQCSVLSNSDNDTTPILHIRFDMTEISINTMVEFMDTKVDAFKIKGVSGIDDILDVFEDKTITFNNPKHELIKKTQYVIYTSGINLMDIRYLHNIDLAKTICNDVITIYETYGIEATRALLLKEFMNVFERAGVSVNYQHFSLLVDIMTNNGDVTSIDRHGMNRIDSDPLSQASFEKTVDKLIAAAVFNKKDTMRSVSSRIMAGMTFEGGTGYCKLILDAKALEQSEYTEEIGQTGRVQELTVDTVVNDIMNQNNEGIFMPF